MRRRQPVAPAGGGQRAGVGHWVRVAPAEVRWVEMCPGGRRGCGRDDVSHLFHVPAGQSRYERLKTLPAP